MKEILSKIFSEAFSSSWLYVITAIAGLAAGIFLAGLYWRAQIADMKAETAQAAALYQDDLRKKERDYAQRLAAATDAKQAEIDRLQSSLDGLRTDADRLRIAASRRSAVPARAGNSCESCQRQVGECVKLLSESAGLFEEGGGLLRDFDADRGAVRKLK